jgi:Na+-transporting NADH:ubiquinone oxidoreductase subunit B
MSLVVIALIPSLLLGMYNIGLQNAIAAGAVAETGWFEMFVYGLLVTLPKIAVSYIVGLGIEFTVAQWKNEEIHEGFLVSGILIPMIVPVGCPLWVLALATAFAVIFAKEVFGGTGMNIVNVALIARAFIFFAYPSVISGDGVWVATETICGLGSNAVDGYTCATALQYVAGGAAPVGAAGELLTSGDMIFGFMPGSIGETSVVAIALGAALLLYTGVASWKTMLSVFVGGIAMLFVFQDKMPEAMPLWHNLLLGGFCFGAVFMATDPVTSARTETGKYIYGFGIGAMTSIIRVLNPGYPEGMMLAILLMNVVAPFIDYCVVQSNVNARAKRVTKKN